jgi:hypothetical protein
VVSSESIQTEHVTDNRKMLKKELAESLRERIKKVIGQSGNATKY